MGSSEYNLITWHRGWVMLAYGEEARGGGGGGGGEGWVWGVGCGGLFTAMTRTFIKQQSSAYSDSSSSCCCCLVDVVVVLFCFDLFQVWLIRY